MARRGTKTSRAKRWGQPRPARPRRGERGYRCKGWC